MMHYDIIISLTLAYGHYTTESNTNGTVLFVTTELLLIIHLSTPRFKIKYILSNKLKYEYC